MDAPGEALKVARPEVSPWLGDVTDAHATVVTATDAYVLRGWCETERVWVYEPA